MRNPADPRVGHAPALERILGSSYQEVKSLAGELPAIVAIYEELELIVDLYADIVDVKAVGIAIDSVTEVASKLVAINTLVANMSSVVGLNTIKGDLASLASDSSKYMALYKKLNEISALYSSLPTLDSVESNLNAILTTADAAKHIKIIVSRLATLEAVYANLDMLQNIYLNLGELKSINHNEAELLLIAANVSSLVLIADNLPLLLTSLPAITTVSGNIVEVAKVGQNIPAVQGVYNFAEELVELYLNLSSAGVDLATLNGSIDAIIAVSNHLGVINALGSEVLSLDSPWATEEYIDSSIGPILSRLDALEGNP